MKGFIGIALALVVSVIVISAGFVATKLNADKIATLQSEIDQTLGATLFVTASPTKLGGSGVAATDTTINLVKLVTPNNATISMSNFGDIGYGTIEPARTNKEFISFTGVTQNADGTAALTGVIRGLNFVSPYTASTTLRKAHPGGVGFVISNPPQLLDSLISKQTDSFVTGTVTFSVSAFPRMSVSSTNPTDDRELVHKFYVDSLVVAGVPDGNYTTFGGFILATTSQIVDGTATSTATRYLVVPSELTNATSSATPLIPVTGSDGKLSQGFLDLTEGFTFSGGVTSTGALVVSGAITTLSTTTINGIDVVASLFRPYGDGRDGSVTISATTTLSADMFYTNLTVNSGITLNTGGYRIYVNGTLTNNGFIANNGGDGGDASGLTGGTVGTAAAGGTLAPGLAGGAGGNGVGSSGSGGAGGTGATSTPGLGGDGVAGGEGGGGCATAGTNPGAVGGFGTAVLENLSLITGYGTSTLARDATSTINFASYFTGASSTFVLSSSGGSGGGSGGCSDTGGGNSGAGGGAGGTGGLVYIVAKTVVNDGTIEALGGDAGNGSDATGADAAGGGGGSGGASGVIMLGYNLYSGSGTISIATSSAGTGGTATGGATNGADGSTGNLGVIFRALIKP